MNSRVHLFVWLRLSFVLLGLVGLISLGGGLQAAVYNREEMRQDDRQAAFRLFIPDAVKIVRAVVVLMPGHEGDGRAMADDPEWCDFAARNEVALLAAFVTGDSYYRAERWAGRVVVNTLAGFADASAHPELKEAPLAFWGHSAGGQFNYNFACFLPGRTLAFVANKGANYEASADARVRNVPALWITGADDTDVRVNNITSLYAENRRFGALWALVIEPGVGHEVGASKRLGMAFLQDALGLRLSAAGQLVPVDPARGWLGDLHTAAIEKAPPAGGDHRAQAWLPGEASARLWAKVMLGETTQNTTTAP